ncbi:MAG TPA: VOC family protein [Kiritimatiellia bacterium]|nr:VOC family protein [Kiritimatiellia bacterium]HMP35362.1 VOC family protein [Kiritimatiellia bacterium]
MKSSWGLVMLAVVAMTGCQRGPQFPPLGEPGVSRHGAVVWRDLVTPDPAAAMEFYGELFGWTFEPLGDTGYVLALLDGQPVAGILDAQRTGRPVRSALWLQAISVPDVRDAARAVVKAGGTIHYKPSMLAGRGRVAVVEDAEGALFQLVTSSSGDPAVREPAQNNWLWAELLAGDTERAATFYQAVFGYEVVAGGEGDPSYRTLRAGDEAQAAILANPFEDTRSAWIPFVRVDDVAATLARCEAKGGRVVVAPDPARRRGSLALVLDPSGAPLAVQTWNPETTGGR